MLQRKTGSAREAAADVEGMENRGRLWKNFGSEQVLRGMWEYFTLKNAWARKILADAAQENKKECKVSGTRSLPSKKFWSKSKEMDTDCNAQTMRRANNAKKSCNWESFREDLREKEVSSVNGPLTGSGGL